MTDDRRDHFQRVIDEAIAEVTANREPDYDRMAQMYSDLLLTGKHVAGPLTLILRPDYTIAVELTKDD